MKLHEAFSPEESKKIYDNFLAIVNDPKRRDKLVKKHGKNAENVAYGTAVNQVKKQAANNIEEPQPEETMENSKLREMVIDALTEKKKPFPDLTGDGKVTKADILKARGVELDEANNFTSGKEFINIKLKKYPKAVAKINQLIDMIGESNFTMEMAEWIWDFFNNASFENPINEDMDLGHEDDEPNMIKADIYQIGKYAMELYKMVDQFDNGQEVDFPHWWQSKIITAKNMISSAKHYLEFELKEPELNAMVDVASEEGAIDEKLKPSMGAGAYVDDFRKSKAPQFKGKSKAKKNKMAVAAYLSAKDKIKEVVLAKLKNK
jgi:hypothetical protein